MGENTHKVFKIHSNFSYIVNPVTCIELYFKYPLFSQMIIVYFLKYLNKQRPWYFKNAEFTNQ